MRRTALGWELYGRTHSAMVLGWVGLAQFLPVFFFSLWAGRLADRVDRKKVVLACLAVQVSAALGLAWVSFTQGPVWLDYLLLAVLGGAGAFQTPASQALLPRLLPRKSFANAVTWLSSGFQVSAMLGHNLGGLVYFLAQGAPLVYLLDAAANAVFLGCILALPSVPSAAPEKKEGGWDSLMGGMNFVWRDRVLLGSLSLDLFAVLLGGATALLPIYASDILRCGPVGLGALQSATFAGAFLMALWIAHRPPMKKAGPAFLWAVAGFGAAILVFSFSRSFLLSLLMLLLSGAFDAVSVVVRHTLVQLRTPDAMRGRVSAVNNVFIGSSNELGEFESGAAAAWLGPVAAAGLGGAGVLVSVAVAAALFPKLRRLGALS